MRYNINLQLSYLIENISWLRPCSRHACLVALVLLEHLPHKEISEERT